jgi:hypothetical protein
MSKERTVWPAAARAPVMGKKWVLFGPRPWMVRRVRPDGGVGAVGG